MRKLRGLVLAGALLLPVSLAQAAEVIHSQAHGVFLTALSSDPDTGANSAVFISREEGNPAVYRIFYGVNLADGTSMPGTGLMPKGAFHVSAKKASLDVDLNDVTMDFQIGDIPEDSVISVDWAATGNGDRESGAVKSDFGGGIELKTVGTTVTRPADAAGTIFGAPFDADSAEMREVHQGRIIMIH